MSLSPADELRFLRAEVERLRGLMHPETGVAPSTHDVSYRRIVESAIDFAVIAMDLEGRVTHWNEGARRILGWSLEELRGQPAELIFTAEDRARGVFGQELRLALEQGRASDERWHERRDGSRFWGSGELMPLRDDAGAPIGMVKILRDRTPQRKLQEERELFILLAEQSPDFVGVADTQGRGLFINRAGRRMVGLPDGDVSGLSIPDFFPLDEREFLLDVVLPAQREKGHWRGRMHFQHRLTGALIPVDYNAFVLRDAAGALTGYATITRDLTDLERMESALSQSEDRLQLALKSAGLALWDWDVPAGTIYLDARAARLFSLDSAVAAAGVKLEELYPAIHPDDREQVRQAIHHSLDTGGGYQVEHRVTHPEGTRWVQAMGRAYRDAAGRSVRFPGIMVDITERKQAELRQRALLMLGGRLRDLSVVGEIAAEGARLLGQTLDVSRTAFALVDPITETITVERDWSDGRAVTLVGSYLATDFRATLDVMKRGQSIVEANLESATWLDDLERSQYRAVDAHGVVGLPLMRQERLVGFVYAHSTSPRAWSAAELDFIREVASQTWEAIERARAEAALREREQDLRRITDESPELISYLDKELVYRFANHAYEEWFGRSLDQVLGHSVRELVGEAGFALREPYFRRVLAGESVRFEAPLDIPGRPYRDLELRLAPRRNLAGHVQGLYLFVLDITERKRAERTLRELNAQLAQRVEQRTRERDQIWNLSDELMAVVGLDGYLKSINPAWSRQLGLDERTLLERPFLELIHPEDHAAVMRVVAGLARGERPHGLEDRLRRADGVYRTFAWTAMPADHGTFYAIARDVTDERETAALQKRLFDVLDRSPDIIGICDAQGRVLYSNASGRRLMGLDDSPEAPRAHEVIEYFAPGERHLLADTVLPAVRSEGKWVGRSRFRHLKTAEELPVELGMFATRDARGQLIGLGMVARDITGQLQHEQALREVEDKLRQSQKMEAVGQLTGGIAHDFNNLLGGIVGAMEMLRRRLGAGRYAEADKYITATMSSAQRAAALTARLLAFGRRQSLDVKPTDINALVAGMAELLRRSLGETVSLKTLPGPDLWLARTDANQFENALLNLSINARDAMPSGGKLTVETHNTQLDELYARGFEGLAAGDYVVLSVSDTGQGMSPEIIARAFEPFFTTKPIGQGTGLGLSMIYGFAKQVGGHVRIYSEVGQGTTVKLFMPRHVGQVASAGAAAPALVPPRAHEGETVLVVEDEPAVRMLVLEILEDLGYAALEAGDARGALPVLEGTGRIDLLVTDVGLPGGMNGRQLAEVARQRRPELQVLFITGYAEGASVRGGFLAPGMEMITKPFALDVLAARIREMIERRSSRR